MESLSVCEKSLKRIVLSSPPDRFPYRSQALTRSLYPPTLRLLLFNVLTCCCFPICSRQKAVFASSLERRKRLRFNLDN